MSRIVLQAKCVQLHSCNCTHFAWNGYAAVQLHAIQPLRTCTYLQLLSSGLESKVLPVKKYSEGIRMPERVKYGGSTLPKNALYYYLFSTLP